MLPDVPEPGPLPPVVPLDCRGYYAIEREHASGWVLSLWPREASQLDDLKVQVIAHPWAAVTHGLTDTYPADFRLGLAHFRERVRHFDTVCMSRPLQRSDLVTLLRECRLYPLED